MKNITFWLLATAILIGQEGMSINWLLTTAYQQDKSLIVLSLIFLFTTVMDIYLGYRIGKLVKQKERNWKIAKFINNQAIKFESLIGKRGEKLTIFILSVTLLPSWLTAIISSWINIPFKTAFPIIFAGCIIWYSILLSIVIGISLIVDDPKTALIIILLLALVIVVVQNLISKQISKKSK